MIIRLLCTFALAASAQTAQSQFEVATVKPNRSGAPRSVVPAARNGRFSGENNTLKTLISAAYAVPEFQIQGPDWLGSERFDVAAKVPEGTPPDQIMPMLRTLLEDRFHLQTHREKVEMSYYALVMGKGGSKLVEIHPDEPMKPPTFPPGTASAMVTNGTLERFAGQLAPMVGRPVVDKTGMTGRYQILVTYAPARVAAAGDVSDPGPDLFTAIQDQLGLKLEAQKGPVEVLKVDRAERVPEEN